MKTISRYIIIAVLAFFALDWIAENPAKIKQARNQLEKVLEVSGNVVAAQYDAASRELGK